jgi:hypothetical protein
MERLNIALLVDVENFLEPLQLFGQFTNVLNTYGKITNKIAVGGWGFVKHLENWRDVCRAQNIQMLGYNGFKGKNAADRSIIAMATTMILDNQCNAVAVYSRDLGFSIGFASLKVLGAKIIVPVINNESIPDADIYIKTDKNKLTRSEPRTELGVLLLKAMPDLFI